MKIDTIYSVFSFSDREKHLKDFSADTDIWIVSDLVLKKRIKTLLLSTNKSVHSGSVMRAQEFWQFLFNRLYPEFRVVSDSLVQSMLRQFLCKNQQEGLDSPQYVKTLLFSISSFIPFFISSSALESFDEWLKKNPDPYLSKWFSLSFKAWKYLLEKKNISSSFLPGILLSDSTSLFFFLSEKKIIFDLGFQLKALEVSCIKHLAEVMDIKILKPCFFKKSRLDSCLWTYNLLENTSLPQGGFSKNTKKTLNTLDSLEEKNSISFFRYSNQLAEIRATIKYIKQFVSQGISLSNIAIVAPDIEYLWPILSLQLTKENLLVNKPFVVSLHSSKEVMLWLARLRVATGGVSYPDLELIFSSKLKKDTSYQKLKHAFSNFYSVKNYKNIQWSKGLLDESIDKKLEMDLTQFLDWAFSFWEEESDDVIFVKKQGKSGKANKNNNINGVWGQVYQVLRVEGGLGIKLSLYSWLLYVEDLLSKKTSPLLRENLNGVSCYNIINSDNLEEEYVIVLDLCFESLKNIKPSILSFSQAVSLSEDLGVSLDASLVNPLEGVLKYLFQLKNKKIMCSWSAMSLEAKSQNASAFFLEEYFLKNVETLLCKEVLPSVFNQCDMEQIEYKSNQLKKKDDLSLSRILYDRSFKEMGPVKTSLESVSITNINRYIECPFVFFTEKILKLQDLPAWDLDMDVMSKGSLFHKLLELIITLNTVATGDQKLLFDRLNQYRQSSLHIDNSSWKIIKEHLVAIANDFIRLEKNQKLISPNLKVEFVEQSLEGVWSKEEQVFVANDLSKTTKVSSIDLKKGFLVKGKVDRIDRDGDYVVMRDYKSSISSRVGVKAWQEKQDLSLFLYYKLWIAHGYQGKLLGAFYVDIKKLNSKGVWLTEKKEYDFLGLSRNSKINNLEQDKIFFELDQEVNVILADMLGGKFSPNPKEKKLQIKTCNSCKWSGLCRISKTF